MGHTECFIRVCLLGSDLLLIYKGWRKRGAICKQGLSIHALHDGKRKSLSFSFSTQLIFGEIILMYVIKYVYALVCDVFLYMVRLNMISSTQTTFCREFLNVFA